MDDDRFDEGLWSLAWVEEFGVELPTLGICACEGCSEREVMGNTLFTWA